MAKDSAAIQKKLFGPFKGLNGSQSPFLRELPPSPNAKPEEYASECINFIIDQKTQELVLRNGVQAADTQDVDVSTSEIQASGGFFKWTDYDIKTGKPRERFLNIVVNETGIPTIHSYRWILTEFKLNTNISNAEFAIIDDSAQNGDKLFVLYSNGDTEVESTTDLTALTNLDVAYLDYDADFDGALVSGSTDLQPPTALNYDAVNANLNSSVLVYSLFKKTVTNADLDLSSWINTLNTIDAKNMTAAQAQNVMYFSSGVGPLLKYDGQNIYKAGMPNAGIAGTVGINEITLSDFETATSRIVDLAEDVDYGLITRYGYGDAEALAGDIELGKAMYVQTFEHGDAKNNYIEGNTYIPAVPLETVDPELDRFRNTEPVTVGLTAMYASPTPGTDPVSTSPVVQYEPQFLEPTKGYDARGAVFDLGINEYVTIDSTDLANGSYVFTVDPLQNTLKKGDIICFRANLYQEGDEVNAPYFAGYMVPILITTRLADVNQDNDELTIDFTDFLSVELVPGGDFLANSRGPMTEIIDPDDELTNNSLDAENTLVLPDTPDYDPNIEEGTSAAGTSVIASLISINSWEQLFAWTWGGRVTSSAFCVTEEFVMSNNLRVNIYRNKCDNRLGNVAVFDPVPNLYLLNIIPNDPFNVTSIGNTFDNCPDTALGAIFEPKNTLIYENADLLPGQYFDDPNYTTLPKGHWISSFKGRLYIAADPENPNILWRSSLLYGTEYFDPGDTIALESPQGDSIQAVVGNDEAVFVLKNESIKVIINDLNNANIRVDEVILGDDGCIAPLSACQLENGVVYLTPNGPAWVEYSKELMYLGANSNGVSRIRDRLVNDNTLDLKRAVGFVDTDKQHYKLYIPKINKPSQGFFNPVKLTEGVVDAEKPADEGKMFVFDYANDAWFEHRGINARGGMAQCNENKRMMYMTTFARHAELSGSSLQWILNYERNKGDLTDYVDYTYFYNQTSGMFIGLDQISYNYTTDWLAMDNPNETKNFLRIKLHATKLFDDLYESIDELLLPTLSGEFNVNVKAYKNWRSDYVQTETALSITRKDLFSSIKCRPNKSQVMKFEISGDADPASGAVPRIHGIEVEAVAPIKAKIRGPRYY